MLFLLLIVVGGAVWFFLKSYNRLQRECQPVKECFSNIQVMLRKKLELTQQLMDVCRASADNEKLQNFKISADRMESMRDLVSANGQADKAIAFMSQMGGQFPNLKTNVNFLQLSEKLTALGDQLQQKREQYNHQASQFNATRNQVPTVFVARMINSFPQAPMLEFGDEASLDRLSTFHTDDGQALEQFIGGIGHKVAGGARAAVGMAMDAGSAVAQKALGSGTACYRYSEGGAVKGPVSRKELDALVLQNKLPPSVFVLEEGTKDWVKYEQLAVKELPPPPDAVAPVPPPPDLRQ